MPDINDEAEVRRYNTELQKRVAELEDAITERKQSDAELLVKNEVFEASIAANSTSDNEGILTYVNSAFIKIFGYENKEETVGKPISDFLKFEDEAINIITALNETGVWEGEYTGLRKDGTTFAAYGVATIIKDRSGDSIGYQSAVLDISDRKRMEEQLKVVSLVFEQTAHSVAILDKEGNIEYVNPKLLELYKIGSKEVLGKHWRSVVSMFSTSREKIQEIMDTVIKKRLMWRGEVTDRAKNGEVAWKEATIFPIEDAKGEITHFVYISDDITERKQAEEMTHIQRDLGMALSATVSLEETLRLCVDAAIRIDGMDCGGVYLIDQSSGALDLAFHKGLSPEFVKGASHYDANAANARVVMAGKPIYIPYQELGVPLDESDRREHLRASAVIPVHHEGQVIACLNLASHTLDEVPVFACHALETIATQIGSAIARVQAEETLRGSEERIRALLNAPTDVMILIDSEGTVLALNEAHAEKLGKGVDEMVDKCIYDFFPPDIAQFRKGQVDKVFSTGKPIRFQEDQRGRTYDTHCYPVFGAGGKVTAVATYAEDITKRLQAEEALRKSEEQYHAVFESATDTFLIFNLKGEIVEANPAGCEMYGYPYEELIGLSGKDIIRPDYYYLFEDFKKQVKSAGQFHAESVDIRKDGSTFDVEVRGIPFHYQGKPHLLAVIRDITERKLAEKELKMSFAQIRSLSAHIESVREEERTQLAREIHDELGQALTALKMDLSWLSKRLPKDKEDLFEKTKSMSKLIDSNIQAMKRISTELRPGLLDDLGLSAALEWQTEEFRNRTQIKCKFTLDPEEIVTDCQRSTAIFRIFQETLTNVARHANATKVEISLTQEIDKLILKVIDNGKGITEEQISRAKSFGIMGMKERVYAWNGEVEIKGIKGRGTTVTVSIPLV